MKKQFYISIFYSIATIIFGGITSSILFSMEYTGDQSSPVKENVVIPYEISTTSEYSVFTSQPSDFKAKFDAVGCFLEFEDKVLLLKRNADKPEGNTWGIPGGKVDKEETLLEAVKRETFEETGINVEEAQFKVVGTNYLILPNKNVTFHMYQVRFLNQPTINLAVDESQKYKWLTVEEAMAKEIMPGEVESFVRYKHVLDKARS